VLRGRLASTPTAQQEHGKALAVNTKDGETVYDVAIAVVWVTDGSVDEINEAWALANCSDCRTVAVAFQGIFTVGDTDVVVPQNRAVAVNYDCERCETQAVAVQLVATLTRMPSDEAMRDLAVVWDDLKRLKRNIADVSLDEIRSELGRIEKAILDILIKDGALVLPDEDPPAGANKDPEEALADDSPADGTSGGEDAEDTSGGVTADTTEPEEETGAEPSPAPSSEPSPAPSSEPEPTPADDSSPSSGG
jgi:putative peptide zinc metalloprotease protein